MVTKCGLCGSANCLKCEGGSHNCTQCKSGYYIDLTKMDECQSCNKYGCRICNSPTNCS